FSFRGKEDNLLFKPSNICSSSAYLDRQILLFGGLSFSASLGSFRKLFDRLKFTEEYDFLQDEQIIAVSSISE
ncbi:hypothetical protein TSAR_008220, partial [Trichomalopsis sarcophagae]